MRKLITFGIALIAFSQMNANNLKNLNEQGESNNSDSLVTTQKNMAPVEDCAVSVPSIAFNFNPRSIEEVIAEDRQITENILTDDGALLYIEKSAEEIIATDKKIIDAPNTAEIRPLYIERTIEDKIAEDNAVIESTAVAVQPLDFQMLNQQQLIVKKGNSLLIGMN